MKASGVAGNHPRRKKAFGLSALNRTSIPRLQTAPTDKSRCDRDHRPVPEPGDESNRIPYGFNRLSLLDFTHTGINRELELNRRQNSMVRGSSQAQVMGKSDLREQWKKSAAKTQALAADICLNHYTSIYYE